MNVNHLKILFVGIMVIFGFAGRTDRSETPQMASKKVDARPVNASAQLIPPARKLAGAVKPFPPAEISSIVNNSKLNSLPKRNNPDLAGPKLKVKAALAKDLDADFYLYGFNLNVRWPLASLVKLMSAVAAVENVGLEKKAVISESAVATEGESGNLEANEQYRIGELVKAMMVVSSNDAASAIAEFYGKENFLKEMKAKAVSLDMGQTTFFDATGISPFNQGTIADTEILARYILEKHPAIFKLSAQGKTNILEESKNMEKELLNINKFAASRPDFMGGKTGFTDEASGNLISIFNHQGHKILIIVFGTDDRFGQTELLYNWVKQAFAFNR